MSILNFPNELLVETLGATDEVNTDFVPDTSGFLQHIRINSHLVDTSTGFLTLSVYQGITLRAQSIIQLADINETLPWVGWLRFDFSKQPLTASESYKLTLQSSGIQPDGVSIVRDYHVANTYNESDQRIESPLKFEIYYRDI